MSSKKSKSKTPVAPPPAPTKKPVGRKGIVKHGNAGSNKPSDDEPAPQRSIFGDWTGKTPMSLLHEHCQKSNWEKPGFDIKRQKDGFLGTVTLSQPK